MAHCGRGGENTEGGGEEHKTIRGRSGGEYYYYALRRREGGKGAGGSNRKSVPSRMEMDADEWAWQTRSGGGASLVRISFPSFP